MIAVDTSTADYGIAYADAGYPVLPLHGITNGRCSCGRPDCESRGKHPRIPFAQASRDENTIRKWFDKWPSANLGITLPGHVVVDVDPRSHGDATLEDLIAKYGPLPETCTARTGGGGSHYLFRAREGIRYGGKLGAGVDLKHGPNAVIVVEPSLHASGGRYSWLDEEGPHEAGIPALAPDWLSLPEEARRAAPRTARIPKGDRNNSLTSFAGTMRRRDMSEAAIAAALLAENQKCDPPLPEQEVLAIAHSVARYAPAVSAAPRVPDDEFANVKTARDVMRAEPKPVHYCIPERIPSGLIVVGGRPKSRKSWLALQAAIATANGTEMMGRWPRQARVLGLFLEDNAIRMRRRLEFLGISPANAPDCLHFEYDWPTGDLGVAKIARWLDAYPDTGLVIVDVLQRFRGARDKGQSHYEADYAALGQLHSLCAQHPQLTVMVIHHIKKGAVDEPVEALSGTFGIAAAADAFIILAKRSDHERVQVHIDGRDWESRDSDFLWEWREQVGWVWLGALETEVTDRQSEIIELAKKGGHVTPSDVARELQIKRPTAHEALRALQKKDLLFNSGNGKYKPTSISVP